MRWPKSYAGKMLFVAFVGTHVPLLTLLCFFIATNSPSTGYTIRIGLIALTATLTGTAGTLYGLHRLLGPVLLTQRALRRYVSDRELPELPVAFTDEAGTLMADTQHTLRQLDDVVSRLTHYDAATALPNRTLFTDRVSHAVSQARRRGQNVAVLMIETDRIEQIVQSLGAAAGDSLARAITQRLAVATRESDVLARFSDHAFAVLNDDAGSVNGLLAQAQRFGEALDEPIRIVVNGTEHLLQVTPTVGIATFPTDAVDADELIMHASAAVHASSNAAVNDLQTAVRFYSATQHAELQERLHLERDLREALVQEQFFLHYQPKVCISSGDLHEVEALVRWNHPERGIVSPADFIPIAEETGIIVELGEWVLREACRQAQQWVDEGQPLKVAVNLSAQQVARTDVVAMTRSVLQDSGLSPSLLELEVTESMLVSDVKRAAEVLTQLRALGVSIALDDFGTGYSSLSYLRNLPVDTVKIDRSFISALGTNNTGDAVVNAVLAMAQGLNLTVVAEGIETAEQLAYLRERGCSTGQGYFFGKPMLAEAIDRTNAGAVAA